jgi:hypothetical protein
MRAFNLCLSSIQITIEHAFGLLKSRFPSLHGMGPHKDIQDMYCTIEALMVLHNMAIDFGDHPSDEWLIDENPDDQNDETNGNNEPLVLNVEGEVQVPVHETDNYLTEQGRIKWYELLDQLF